MQENSQANLFTHPPGAHTQSDRCRYKLTCTHMVMNRHKHAACACTHTKLLACTGTSTSTHPTLLTPTHVFPWVGVGTGALCASLLPAPLWPSQKGISSCKVSADRFRDSLPSDCWAKLIVHQNLASPALPCWLPGAGEEGPTGGHLQHPMESPLLCSLPSTVNSAFTLPDSAQLIGHCPPQLAQLRALLKRGGQESPQCPALLQYGGQAQECGPLCPGSHPADIPLGILSPVGTAS